MNFIMLFNLMIHKDVEVYFDAMLDTKKTYTKFHVVIVFDVTYKTNNFSMSFPSFTCVNHHRQPVLLGCVLLSDE